MRIYRRHYGLILALGLGLGLPLSLGAAPDSALHDPEGEWQVEDKTAHIRIFACASVLWGVISWAKEPGSDTHNPDPSKRTRPILGLPILLAMQPGIEGRWSGNIYNAENGKIYASSLYLKSPDILHVEGCTLYGLLCGGEDWTRQDSPLPDAATRQSLCNKTKEP